jgi:hypothetical protein
MSVSRISALRGEGMSWPLSELPSAGQRWTVRRKAAVIDAVREGWLPVENACQLYDLSVDEILAWERDIDRYGVSGLRSTRLQIYRETDKTRQQHSHAQG